MRNTGELAFEPELQGRVRWLTSWPHNPRAPAPPAPGEQPDWLPLGVWALAQEEKGDAYMFFQPRRCAAWRQRWAL